MARNKTHSPHLVTKYLKAILKGLQSSSPALTRSGYAGSSPKHFITPERVESSVELELHYTHAAIARKNYCAYGFLHQRPRPFLRDQPLREELHRYLGGILTHLDCQSIIIGGVEDHVHILSTLSCTCAAAEMVKEVKRGSSLWIKTKSPGLHDFAWQSGYGIFSIGNSQVETVRKYIAGQDEHHRKVSFQDELRKFLKRYEVAFDERHVWD